MAKTLVFDETDCLADVVEKYRTICVTLGIEEPERAVAENLVRSFHLDLARTASLGSDARLEKTIVGRQGSLCIVGTTKRQRSRMGNLISRLLGRA